MQITQTLKLLVATSLLAAASPALADVKAGVDAWAKGDYATAVREWQAPAAAGDPDAQFNMAQAYRLGRGVESDAGKAEVFYAKAAKQGHMKAADNYGLLLFQEGRREDALPYVNAASDRGDPRAQYLLGIAYFNGDLAVKDWVRAYALLTLANTAGLPQAKPAIAKMDSLIPLKQRQQAQALAQSLKQKADRNRAQQLASADLGVANNTAQPKPGQALNDRQLPRTTNRVPRPIGQENIAPSLSPAQAAVANAGRVSGTETPATAGADYTRVPASAPRRAVAKANGPWRVQLGAFSVHSNADRLWSKLSGNAALRGTQKILLPSGRFVRLQAGGFSSRSAAQTACNTLKRNGQTCLVTK